MVSGSSPRVHRLLIWGGRALAAWKSVAPNNDSPALARSHVGWLAACLPRASPNGQAHAGTTGYGWPGRGGPRQRASMEPGAIGAGCGETPEEILGRATRCRA